MKKMIALFALSVATSSAHADVPSPLLGGEGFIYTAQVKGEVLFDNMTEDQGTLFWVPFRAGKSAFGENLFSLKGQVGSACALAIDVMDNYTYEYVVKNKRYPNLVLKNGRQFKLLESRIMADISVNPAEKPKVTYVSFGINQQPNGISRMGIPLVSQADKKHQFQITGVVCSGDDLRLSSLSAAFGGNLEIIGSEVAH